MLASFDDHMHVVLMARKNIHVNNVLLIMDPTCTHDHPSIYAQHMYALPHAQACSKYLADCDSVDNALSPHLVKLASTLVQSFLQHHRTREVRTLAACCVADIFRVFFPDPPYDDEQLKVRESLGLIYIDPLPGMLVSYVAFSIPHAK